MLTLWAVALCVLTSTLLGGSASAASTAARLAPKDVPSCAQAEPRSDNTIHIRGCLSDVRDKPPAPVPGVDVKVQDDSGKVVGEGTSDESGAFDIRLPGASIDNLGETFTVSIDESTLPDGTALRDPDQVSVEVTLRLEADAFVTFPIGEDTADHTDTATRAVQLAVGGVVFALLLAMASIGMSVIYGTTGLTNFAYGELITFGALVAYSVDRLPGEISISGKNVTVVVAVLVATVASGLFGWLQDRGVWRPLRHRRIGLIAMMVVSIGFAIFLRSVFQYLAGGSTHQYSQYSIPEPWNLGPVVATPKDLAIAVISLLVLIATVTALRRTRTGKATRAVADNPALAAASGIDVDSVISVVWIVGAALAGLAGVLFGLSQGFDFQFGTRILLLVFAATILGGLGTAWGAIVGALIIGMFIELSTLFMPSELKFVGALAVLIVVLLIRPQGLLGKPQRVG